MLFFYLLMEHFQPCLLRKSHCVGFSEAPLTERLTNLQCNDHTNFVKRSNNVSMETVVKASHKLIFVYFFVRWVNKFILCRHKLEWFSCGMPQKNLSFLHIGNSELMNWYEAVCIFFFRQVLREVSRINGNSTLNPLLHVCVRYKRMWNREIRN